MINLLNQLIGSVPSRRARYLALAAFAALLALAAFLGADQTDW
jgi:hypothetical protein